MATIDIDDFTKRVQELRDRVAKDLPVINARIAKSALSLVQTRIVNDGKMANGSPLGTYSDNALPAFFFKDKGLGKGADKALEAKLKANKKAGIDGISYKDWRGVQGLQTNHIDLQVTGETWKDFDVISTENTPTSAKTTVANKGSITRAGVTTEQVAQFNADRFGDYLVVSEEEEKELDASFDHELQFIIDSVFER